MQQDAEHAASRIGPPAKRLPQKADLTGAGSHQAGKQSHQSGLAGSIGTSDGKSLTWLQ
jgi:hypothetical protein